MKKLVVFILALVLMMGLTIPAFADNGKLTVEEAKKAALEYAEVKEEDATFTKAHKDWDNGRYVYEIEFWVGNTEYDMDVDMETGKIYDFSTEIHGGYAFENAGTESKKTNGELTKEEALAKALERAGVKEEEVDFVKKVERDYEHGVEVFEVEFYCNGFEYNIDVEVQTGRIVSFEKERD